MNNDSSMIALQKMFELNKNDGDASNTIEHRYTDYGNETGADSYAKLSFLTATSVSAVTSTSKSSGITIPFPLKLHEMLDQIEKDGLAPVISWQPHGRCFVVHDQKQFASEVMVKYFRQTKFASFQRQLNLYGFNRLTSGRDKGGYYNELFLRGKKFLCHRIQRIKIKGTGVRKASSPETEPQFYSMPPVAVDGGDSNDNNNGNEELKKKKNQRARVAPSPVGSSTPSPVLPASLDGFSSWSHQLAMNQAILNNQVFSQQSARQFLQQRQRQPSALQNPLAALCSSSAATSLRTNTASLNINDLQRMIREQQAKLSLSHNAFQQAAAAFPNMQAAAASALPLFQLSQAQNSASQQREAVVPNHIASMMRQNMVQVDTTDLQQQQHAQQHAKQQQQHAQQQLYRDDSDNDDDESQQEFDQILSQLVGMPTAPTPAQLASNPLSNDLSLANLYEMITD